MQTLLLWVVFAQAVVVPGTGASASTSSSPWGRAVEWKENGAVQRVWVSPAVVAELQPSAEGAAAVKRVDASAVVVGERARVRLWKVKDAAAVRQRVAAVVAVVNDLPSTASRARVPVGLVCGETVLAVAGLEALERAAREPGCRVDFWALGVTK